MERSRLKTWLHSFTPGVILILMRLNFLVWKMKRMLSTGRTKQRVSLMSWSSALLLSEFLLVSTTAERSVPADSQL